MFSLISLKTAQTSEQMSNTVLDILTKAKEQNLVAFIGGGYARDTILNKPIKDIDVFVLYADELSFLTLTPEYGSVANLGGSGGNLRDDVVYIEKYDDKDVDVIYIEQSSILNVCYNFDTSICQCYTVMNDEGGLETYISEDFKQYLDNNIIYLYKDIKSCDSHLDRIRAKFPDAIFEKKMSDCANNKFTKWSD